MIDRHTAAHRELVDACAAVREYAGSPASLAVIRMLDALEAAYVIDLRDVAESGLIRLQSALKQSASIRDAVAGNDDALPKI